MMLNGRKEMKCKAYGGYPNGPLRDTPTIAFSLPEKLAEKRPVVNQGNVPRITKLLALAIKMDGMIRDGTVRDYADLARLGQVSRARITQLMNLLYLAPDIQEEILNLAKTTQGRDPISETRMRKIVGELDWERQRAMWRGVCIVGA